MSMPVKNEVTTRRMMSVVMPMMDSEKLEGVRSVSYIYFVIGVG
jgi:hypothetical protein